MKTSRQKNEALRETLSNPFRRWLADKLEAHGEKVDKDFAGLTVWARTTTGQAIYADGIIEAICAELNAA